MALKKEVIRSLIESKQEIDIDEICIEAGCSSIYCSNILRSMKDEGKVIKDGRIWKNVNIDNSQKNVINMTDIIDIEEKFKYMQNLVRMVINGVNPSLLITGMSGVGKSHIVLKELKNNNKVEGEDYIVVKGHSSALGLYTTLYNNSNKLIVFDDCDSIFKDMISLNILKAGLDSYNERTISWHSRVIASEDLENTFTFTGQIIFISNLNINSINRPILSRTFAIDINMTLDEMFKHINDIKHDIEPMVSIHIKDEVLNYLNDIKHLFESFNIRTFIKALRIRIGADSSCDWQKMVKIMLK